MNTTTATLIEKNGNTQLVTLIERPTGSIVAFESTSNKFDSIVELKATNIANPAKFIASVIVRLDDQKLFKSVMLDGVETKILYEKPEVSTETIKFVVLGGRKYDVGIVLPLTDINGNTTTIKITDLPNTTLVEYPANMQYTKNEELNKFIAKFDIPLEVFNAWKLVVPFNVVIKSLRTGAYDSFYLPKNRKYLTKYEKNGAIFFSSNEINKQKNKMRHNGYNVYNEEMFTVYRIK